MLWEGFKNICVVAEQPLNTRRVQVVQFGMEIPYSLSGQCCHIFEFKIF